MDNKKQIKEENVGADGLTKKQRRAQKVQAKQVSEKTVGEIDKPETPKEIKQEKPPENSEQMSEKEKRKLEWQKKLAEQQKLSKKDVNVELSKAEQKAKRREIQEAQRLAKIKQTEVEKIKTPIEVKKQLPPMKKIEKKEKIATLPKKTFHESRVQLLNHLYTSGDTKLKPENSICLPNIHSTFIQLGVQYSTKTILGSNARCISLLYALTNLIKDLKSPPEQEFCRYLEGILQISTEYLQKCRPMAVSMTNALRLFKLQLTQINTNLSDEEKRVKLLEFITTYINDEILTAGKAISLKVSEKISNSDVILIYGCSSLINRILSDAFKNEKQFKVIVVDSRPLLEGKEMLRRLTEVGIDCSYISINALSYVMPKVSKVLLGAHALLANGYVMSRTGTAQVALVAQAYNKPVLVCCETYKFSEKVQTDSLVYNEIGDPDSLLTIHTDSNQISSLNGWKECNKLTPLNLMYDITPPDLVTAVVTELAILPCTSVPVVLRIKPTEI